MTTCLIPTLVKFEQSRYIHNFASADDVQSVVLTIINSNLHISCSMEDGKPVLNLEVSRKALFLLPLLSLYSRGRKSVYMKAQYLFVELVLSMSI